MTSKNYILVTKIIMVVLVLESLFIVYKSYLAIEKTYYEDNIAIWITLLISLYWIIVLPIIVRSFKQGEKHQMIGKFLVGISLFIALALLVMSFSWIAFEKRIEDYISYALNMMMLGCSLLTLTALHFLGRFSEKVSLK